MTKMAYLAGAILALGFVALPALADGPVTVKLDLYDGDKYSHAFSEGLRAAVGNDARYVQSDTLPPDGMKMTMNDAISSDPENGSDLAAYSVTLKTGAGKFIAKTEGFCDVKKFDMCGRVVAEDSYNAYVAYVAKHGA